LSILVLKTPWFNAVDRVNWSTRELLLTIMNMVAERPVLSSSLVKLTCQKGGILEWRVDSH
jgi:hypothetical protein